MSEEKINIWVNQEDVQNIIDCYEKDIEYIKQLEQENQQLKDRIAKTIEYINNHIHQETFTGYMDSYELKRLLEILKGDKE